MDLLVHSGSFLELERITDGKRLTAEQIETAIEECPEVLGVRPSYKLEDGAIVFVSDSEPLQWSVYLHLWRKDGGRSDLTVELTIVDTGDERYKIELDGIRVL